LGKIFDIGEQHVGDECDPYLRLHRVGRSAEECFYAQVLFDPFEEEFDLPPCAVEFCDRQGCEMKCVSKKNKLFAGLGIDDDHASKGCRARAVGVKPLEFDCLVLHYALVWLGFAVFEDFERSVRLESRDEEDVFGIELREPVIIQHAAIKDDKRTGVEFLLPRDVGFVDSCFRDDDARGDVAVQVEHRVEFDRSLGFPKRRPIEEVQTKIDDGSIEDPDRRLDPKSRLGGQRAHMAVQLAKEIGVDFVWPAFIGVCEGRSANRADAPMILKCRGRLQGSYGISQGFSLGYLAKEHGDKLRPATHRADPLVPAVGVDAALKSMSRNILEHLRHDGIVMSHKPVPPVNTAFAGSNQYSF